MKPLAMLICLIVATPLYALADDVVERRGAEPSLRGEISLSDAGVTVRSRNGESRTGTTHFVTWDRVRDVRMFNPLPGLDEYLRTAEDLWRARSRLQRGDAVLAEELFERLFEQYRGATHEIALLVAEGLLRCRLERFDLPRAVIPALETARLRRAGMQIDAYDKLAVVYDENTSLCMYLPPVWIDARLTQRLAVELSRYDAGGDEVVAALAALYAASITPEAEHVLDFSRDVARHPGVRLMRELVGTRMGDTSQRDVYRGRLMRDMRGFDDWAEAWARYHVGVTLLNEQERSRAEVGALQLSHLPARFAQRQPFLAGLAISHLVAFSEMTGSQESAASLRVELDRRYAFHPIRRFSR